ncbi:hypothetical protein V0288_23795 [Pannus brasiliensis CCIBt3594]|uniref:Uncharacterized protein n=1 Tax=Pannus brasiliensis CCIBt3594 TaxID=1427578 RepID=A0AAW9R1Y4_9CHRO
MARNPEITKREVPIGERGLTRNAKELTINAGDPRGSIPLAGMTAKPEAISGRVGEAMRLSKKS